MTYSWLVSHVHHLIAYPVVAWLARKLGKYEIEKLAKEFHMDPAEAIAIAELVMEYTPAIIKCVQDVQAAVQNKKDPIPQMAALEDAVRNAQTLLGVAGEFLTKYGGKP